MMNSIKRIRFINVMGLVEMIYALAAGGKKELSQRPPNSADMPTFETKPSTVGALVTLPMAELSNLVNSKIPRSFSGGGNGRDVCIQLPGIKTNFPPIDIPGPEVCAGTKYEFSAERTGDVAITSVGSSAIQISFPISFEGSGGFRGDVASAIKVDKKNFKGALEVAVVLTPTITEDWCPQLETSVSYVWTSNPKVEIVGGVWVDVKKQVEDKLNEKIPELVSEARKAVDCEKFRGELAAVYGSKSFLVNIPSVTETYINIQPTEIGFSGLKVEPSLVKAAALISANIELATNPLNPALMPLPKLKTIAAAAPRMSLNVPVRVSYTQLTEAVSKLVSGKNFEQTTPVGKVSVTINKTEIYPSKDRLVVGIGVTADLPGSFIDTKGTVYLLAIPTVENGTRVVLKDVNYSQTLDNAFWSVVATLFEGRIREAISEASVYDLTADFAKAKESLVKKLNDPTTTRGVKVTLSEVDMAIGRVAVADKELAVEGLFSALSTIEPKP